MGKAISSTGKLTFQLTLDCQIRASGCPIRVVLTQKKLENLKASIPKDIDTIVDQLISTLKLTPDQSKKFLTAPPSKSASYQLRY